MTVIDGSVLRHLNVFNVPVVAHFFFDDSIESERMRLYISLLDYLRLLILEYLPTSVASEPAWA
ncbi:MAG: hypothetical protein DCF25_18075 [Leptolyngbya foveolarum]|uniref:Uncharacterized protein n=1 Tax=Leptolyngbya foveolarum TaxID=47253 RepID=A0A2W4TX23_9CYAN|nr:MAG: hypothetical protein DCF25_18075 [Leptolyngbya foveolarum]